MTTETEIPEIEDLPPLVSIKRTGEVLTMSRPTVWRRVADGSLQLASGPTGRQKKFVTKASIQRFAQPRATLADEAAS